MTTLLYVEDDPLSRKVMGMMAKRVGYTLTMFEDSARVMERARALDPAPDVILLDIHVQPYSGFEMLSMFRNAGEFAHTPIVALTASVMSEEVAQLRQAGFDGCIAKPIDTDTFPEAVEAVLRGESVWRILG